MPRTESVHPAKATQPYPTRAFCRGMLAVFLVAHVGCVARGGPFRTRPEPNTILRVALFPWIPDEASPELVQHIKFQFEERNPDIELQLVIDKVGSLAYAVPPADPKEDAPGWWTKLPTDGGFHVAEVDALLLADLAERKTIRPWSNAPGREDWHPAVGAATEVKGSTFGVPHWLCGHFVFSREPAVRDAASAAALERALTPIKPPRFAAELAGSFTVSSLYLDAYSDTYGQTRVAEGLAAAAACPDPEKNPSAPMCLDGKVIADLRRVVRACADGRAPNPCLEGGTYSLCPDVGAKRFAFGQVGALLGYSERLHVIRAVQNDEGDTTPILISSAPLGSGESSLVFVDVFVLHSSCDDTCEAAAQKFVTYMNEPSTHEWIQFHKDRDGSPPRYLLSATKSAWDLLRRDPYYATFEKLIAASAPYPNGGLADHRKAIRNNVERDWAVPSR